MNVAKMTMDPEQARKALAEYTAALRRRADAEYQAIRDGLEAMAAGRAVLNLGDAIRDAPVDEQGRPRLAVARADRKQVMFRWGGGSTAVFDAAASPRYMTHTLATWVDLEREHGKRTQWGSVARIEGWALVPLVPPAGLRAIGGAAHLREHYILWEVERWADERLDARPDVDPYLLRHLGGDLYAVVHEWDLTELERAVMVGRAHS